MDEQVKISLEETRALASRVLLANGFSADHARAIADTVTIAERDECRSHGLFRLSGYVRTARNGKASPDAVPTLKELAPGVLRVDGGGGFAPLALEAARAPLAELARRQGIAALSVVNTYHLAALWLEIEPLASLGLVAFAFVSTDSVMPPAGGSRPLYGTNPVAFGWPRDGKPPLVFDQSSAACARGEIMIRERDGAPLPPGWAVDRDGQPTTDPRAALEGAQLPFGGYKGANIALMVELLAGALVGDLFSFEATELDPEDSDVTTGGEFMIAIDPGRCLDGRGRKRQLAHAEQLFERVLEQDGARLPSDRRCAARQRSLENGIAIPRSLYDDLQQLIGGQ